LVLSGIWIAVKRTINQKEEKQKKPKGWWKYFNYAITALMFLFMFHALFFRYQVTWQTSTGVILSWLLLIGLAYYIFSIRLRKRVL